MNREKVMILYKQRQLKDAVNALEESIIELFEASALKELGFSLKLTKESVWIDGTLYFTHADKTVCVDSFTIWCENALNELSDLEKRFDYWANNLYIAQESWLAVAEPISFDRKAGHIAVLRKGDNSLVIQELYTYQGASLYMFTTSCKPPVYMVAVVDLLDELGEEIFNGPSFDDEFFLSLGTYRFYKDYREAYEYAVTAGTRDSWVEYPEQEHHAPDWVSKVIPL